MNDSPRTPTASSWREALVVSRIDEHRWVSAVAAVLVVISVAMAQFGLPRWGFHGPLHAVGIMDPFCGGTRAARLTMMGRFAEAWEYNPAGVLVTLGAALLLARAFAGVVTRRWVNVRWRPTNRQRRAMIVTLGLALIVLEVRQQGLAEMLSATPPT